MTLQRHIPTLLIAAGLAMSLAACSDSSSNDAPSASSTSASGADGSQAAGPSADGSAEGSAAGSASKGTGKGAGSSTANETTLQKLLVKQDAAPDGFTYEDPYALFGGFGSDPKPQVTPEQCAPWVFDSSTMLGWASLDKNKSALAMFSTDSDATIMVKIDAKPEQASVEGCESFTKQSVETGLGKMETTIGLEPQDIAVDGAENLQAVKATDTAIKVDGQDVTGAGGQDRSTIVKGSVTAADGTTRGFTVVGTAGVDNAHITQLANAEVAKLKG